MKRFKFRLQRVLDVRAQFRDEARQELVRRNAERDHELSVLRHLEQEYLQNAIVDGGTYSASDLLAKGIYSERLEKAIEHQEVVVQQAKNKAQEALEAYIEASKEAKAIEMLREKKLTEFNEQVLKEEADVLDEIALQKCSKEAH
ncbi:MAG: flagellar export protein FliJ [Bdellovibrionota bacterium]|jgi:flagellar protein FliJ